MVESKKYKQSDLLNVLKGACLLASGGGGTYASAKNLVDNFRKNDYYNPAGEDPEFEVVTKAEAIRQEGYAVVIAYIGAPEALSGVDYPDAVINAVKQVQKHLEAEDKPLKYLVPVETGALGLCVPCLVSNKLGLPVIDCDGAGRAVPELTMLTFSAEGVSVNPTCLANADGYFIQLDVGNNGEQTHMEIQESAAEAIENLTRPILGLKQFNQIAGLAMWVMSPQDIHTAVEIEETLTRAMETGKMIEKCDGDQIISYLKEVQQLKVYKMFYGKFVESGCSTITEGGFDHGKITIKNEESSTEFIGIFQNETLLAWNSNCSYPIAMAPDSIAYYVEDEQKVYSNGDIVGSKGNLVEHLRNKSVTVIGIASDDVLRKNEDLKVNARVFKERMEQGNIMKCFKKTLLNLGYAGPYVKIEDIWEENKE